MRGAIVVICALSLLIIKSIRPDLFNLQAFFIISGFLIFFLLSKIDSRVYQNFWPLFYLASLVFLGLTFFGPEVRGSKRWIEIFSLRIQPSELIKPFLIISWAGFLSSTKKREALTFLKFLAFFLPPFILVFKQPDLGNALVYLFVFLMFVISSDFSFTYFLLPVASLILGLPLIWQHLADYQRLRIITFLTPGFDLQGAGYNALQSLITIGSGGLFGRGIGQGTQARLRFLPEFHTDFIFASAVEQLGFLGGAFLLFLYFFLLWQILKRGGRAADKFQVLVAQGVFSQILFQVFINVGMNLGLLPITGITLPLFSFGGSSLIATLIALGIVAGFSKRKEKVVAIR